MQKSNISPNPEQSKQAWHWAGLVASIVIIIRIGLFLIYQPVEFGDTPSYRRSAEAVLDGFESYDGTRTPGYPIFLALVGTDNRVWILQMVLGVGISLLLFYIALKLTGHLVFAAIVGLSHSLNLGQLLFEANLLTETLTTFWIVLSLAGVVSWLLQPEKRSVWLAGGLGITSSFALITRPVFLFFPFWILIFLLYERWNRNTLWRGLFFILPVMLIIGSWVGFIYSRYGDWSLTTMTGYHLIQHVGGYFEYVPDEYAGLRDTYLEFRERHIAEFGTQTNTIWDAIPAMQQASGQNFYDLSDTLASISINLIIEHPLFYLKNVIQGWLLFWLAPVYWSPDSLVMQFLVSIIQPVIIIQRSLLIAGNIIFVFTSILAVVMHKRLLLSQNKRLFLWCWLGTIWIASFLQTLLDHGDNPRFSVPLQSLIVLWVLWVVWSLLQKRQFIALPKNKIDIHNDYPRGSAAG